MHRRSAEIGPIAVKSVLLEPDERPAPASGRTEIVPCENTLVLRPPAVSSWSKFNSILVTIEESNSLVSSGDASRRPSSRFA